MNTGVDTFKTIPNTIFNQQIRKKYYEFEKDYQNEDYTIADLRKKYGNNPYIRLYHEYIERGGKPRFNRPKRYDVKNYHYNKREKRWRVTKRINGKRKFFGAYKTEAEAKKRVEELKKNNWKI
jgi:hypothetical protein